MFRSLAAVLLAVLAAVMMAGCGGDASSAREQYKHARNDKSVATAADYETAVQELYVSYFGRPADPAGLANFENALLGAHAPTDIQDLTTAYATNPAIQSLINSFGSSQESKTLYGSGSTTAFVTAIFQNVLNRAPQPSGLSFWVNAIDNQGLTQGNAALAIMAGALANKTSQGLLDAQLINNRLTVASYFTSQVSSQNAVSAYVGSTAAATARTMLSAVSAATNPASYEPTVASAVAGLGNAAKGMSFNPARLSFNYQAGSSTTLVITATATTANEFSGTSSVYAVVSDQNGMFSADSNAVLSGANAYAFTLHTSSTLAKGQYQGNLQVKLCSDSACNLPLAGAPWSIPYVVQVAAAPLVATNLQSTYVTMHTGGALPSPIAFSVQGQTLVWAVSTNVTWMQSSVSSGSGNGGFSINFTASTLAAGTYSGNVTVSSTDGQSVVIPVTLTVMASSFQITSGYAAFTAVNGAPIATQPISFSLTGNASDPWSASSDSAWLTVSPTSGVTPGVVNIGINPSAGPLSSGTYAGNATVSSAGATNLTIPVSLSLIPASLGAAPGSLVFGGANGRNFGPLSANLGLNTGANSWPWTLSGVPSWLTPAATSGSVSGSGTNVTFTPKPQTVGIGSSTAVMRVTSQINGDTVSISINASINLDQHRLLTSEAGVAFTSVPGWSRLTRNVTVSDNFGNSTAWTAQSNQSWLTATASGTTGAGGTALTLTANPTGMAVDAISYATVTITPTDTSIQPVTVKVGMWNGSTAPAAATLLPQTYGRIVADTIRPLVYVNNAGASIDVYNVYTGQMVGSYTGLGASMGDMSVSGNGDRLYALDVSSKAMVVLDLVGQKTLETWPLYAAISGTGAHLLSIHPNGQEVVLVGDRTAYTGDGKLLGGLPFSDTMAASTDSTVVFDGFAERMDYTAVSGGTLLINGVAATPAPIQTIDLVGVGDEDIAISPDGTTGYVTVQTSGPFNCAKYDLTTNPATLIGILPGSGSMAGGYLTTVKVGIDGRVYCGAEDGYNFDVLMYSPAGAFIKGFKFSSNRTQGLIFRQIAIAPDGYMMVALTTDPQLAIIAVGP
jgi:hypothetical protein